MSAVLSTRTAARAGLAVISAAALTLGLASSASAATGSRTIVDGSTTYNLSITGPNTAPGTGANVTVTGTGYNSWQGIYVGLCAVSGGQGANKPTPCLGGQDESGTTGASYWVSNFGGGLLPNSSTFKSGGSFTAKIHIKADLGGGNVCGDTVDCAIVTRADHTDSSDRKYDVHIPVTFS
ncbi:hypothetical protein ACFWIA_33100 [Streptomyces sp. NPDC127068]|uniref:hypothetical protein n=1 Tax=Streptomyces sp. NPDC127068 TaxID=3347127 RepID=UPI00364F3191